MACRSRRIWQLCHIIVLRFLLDDFGNEPVRCLAKVLDMELEFLEFQSNMLVRIRKKAKEIAVGTVKQLKSSVFNEDLCLYV